MQYITNINDIDKELAVRLGHMSKLAYSVVRTSDGTACHFDTSQIPAGSSYSSCGSWTGVDSFFGHEKETECFGQVFRSNTAPYDYYFAFRGTKTVFDLFEDLHIGPCAFTPLPGAPAIDSSVQVELGFYAVYTQSNDQVLPMREQLVALLNKYRQMPGGIGKIYVTGHSLGASLSTLFTLDLLLAFPDLPFVNYNFASLRVGNAAFVDVFSKLLAKRTDGSAFIRIQNTHDEVPRLPEWEGYHHLSPAFLVSFKSHSPLERLDPGIAHSILNYIAVLECAASSATGICEDDCMKLGGTSCKLISSRPAVVND